jgi:hypothetical protein
MGHIPQGTVWYIAILVYEVKVQGDSRNVVHRNMVLIRADSPEDAYAKALSQGQEGEIAYKNPAGKLVRIGFRGISELSVVYDELDHGAELIYEEDVGVTEEEIEKCLRAKDELRIFRPSEPTAGPDYSSAEVIDDVGRLLTGSSDE